MAPQGEEDLFFRARGGDRSNELVEPDQVFRKGERGWLDFFSQRCSDPVVIETACIFNRAANVHPMGNLVRDRPAPQLGFAANKVHDFVGEIDGLRHRNPFLQFLAAEQVESHALMGILADSSVEPSICSAKRIVYASSIACIGSGFGLLGGEVHFFAATPIHIDMTFSSIIAHAEQRLPRLSHAYCWPINPILGRYALGGRAPRG